MYKVLRVHCKNHDHGYELLNVRDSKLISEGIFSNEMLNSLECEYFEEVGDVYLNKKYALYKMRQLMQQDLAKARPKNFNMFELADSDEIITDPKAKHYKKTLERYQDLINFYKNQ